MKKLLFLLFLIPITTFAKLYPGSITYNDGTTINAFIELPEYPDDSKLKFRLEEKGKNEKAGIDEVKSFEIYYPKGEKVNYITIRLGRPKIFNTKELTIDSKKSWVQVVKEGKISIYATHVAYSAGSGTGGGGMFYVKRPNDDYALELIGFSSGGLEFQMNQFKHLTKGIKIYFDATCPKMAELLEKKTLTKKGMTHLIDLYEANCD